MLIPAAKTRFEIGINLKGQKASGVLALDTKTTGMVSHRIELQSIEDLSSEVIDWLNKAYESAGCLFPSPSISLINSSYQNSPYFLTSASLRKR